jgi:hypothetical protein
MAAFATLARNSGLTLIGIRSALHGILTFAKAPERWRTQDAARVLPKFDLVAGACFPPRRRPAKRTAMGARIVGFILYLALSYGAIYVLVSKRFLREWNIGEPQLRAAIVAAIVLIIAVGAMLVGPLPMVLMVVALVAFIDYIRSSESLAATAGDRTAIWRTLPSLVDAIGSLRRTLAGGGYDFGRVRHLVFPVARRALGGVARLSGYVRSLTTRALDHRNGGEASASADDNDQAQLAQAIPEQIQPPPLTLAEGHGLDAVRAALAPPKPAERMPTRDEAKRLLDRLEGRA